MKLNLEHLEVFTTLDNTQCQVVNARKQMANIIYSQGAGYGWQDKLLPSRCGTETKIQSTPMTR